MAIAITDQLSRGTNGDAPFPLAYEGDMKVSYVTVLNNTERDAIPEWKRVAYMLCYVTGTNLTYRLGANTTIAGQVWTAETFGVPDEVLTEDEILDADGFIKPALIKNIFLNDNFVVDSEAEMLGLSTVTGNFVIRTDTGGIYVKLNNDDPATIDDFSEITYPGAVLSVNGDTGAVTITLSDLITADSAGFNTAVGATATISGINTDISTLETDLASLEADLADKADLVGGTVPLAQLPYSFGNGLTGTTDISVGGTLTDNLSIFGNDTYNFVISTMVDIEIEAENSIGFDWNDGSVTLVLDSTAGFRYTSDLSATFGNHSLITKQYVDQRFWKDSDTTTLSGTPVVDLGHLTGTSLQFRAGDTLINRVVLSIFDDPGAEPNIAISSTATASNTARFMTTLGKASLEGFNATGGQFSFNIDGLNNIAEFFDQRTIPVGIQYNDNYASGFTARSLVDKGYVDSLLTDGGGIWTTTGTSNLVGEVNINGTGNPAEGLLFNNQGYFSLSTANGVQISADEDLVLMCNNQIVLSTSDLISLNTGNGISGGDIEFGTKTFELDVFSSAIITSINSSFAGLTYNADYSANYTARSLVDKTYADSVIDLLTVSNGLTRTSDNITLGGQLTSHALIVNGGSAWFGVRNPSNLPLISTTSSSASLGNASSGNIAITYSTAGTNLQISDLRTTKTGIQYSGDYSADFVARSLVDKAYVDSVAGGISNTGAVNELAITDASGDLIGSEYLTFSNFTLNSPILNIIFPSANYSGTLPGVNTDEFVMRRSMEFGGMFNLVDTEVVTYHAANHMTSEFTSNGVRIPTDTTALVTVVAVARQTDGTAGSVGDSAAYVLRGLFKNASGTVTQVGATNIEVIGESNAAWDATLSVGGSDVFIDLTGGVDMIIDWNFEITVMQL